jgi:hypothetical protein
MMHMAASVKEEPVPLPLPKNLVLVGMIEAAERQARLLEQNQTDDDSLDMSDTCNAHDDDDEERTRLDPTLAGMSAFVGPCGTYAVRESLGLAVLPYNPNKQHQSHKDEKGPDHHKSSSEEEKKAEEPREPFTIEEGQRVQVVGVDEGVYVLARGAGYVVATVNQLVKSTSLSLSLVHACKLHNVSLFCLVLTVGGPLEKSCQLEGMLQSVERKQQELQRELDEVNRLTQGLKDKVRLEQQHPEEHPVISARQDLEEENENDNDVSAIGLNPVTPTKMTKTDHYSSPMMIGLQLTQSTDSTEVELGDPRTPAQYGQMNSQIVLHSPAHSCPMPLPSVNHLDQPFMDGHSTGLPRYRINSDDDLHGLTWGFGCGSTLFGERLIGHDSETTNVMALSFDDSLVEDAATIGAQSRGGLTNTSIATHASGDSLRSNSFECVNFRTGMSGHRGLTQIKKKSSPIARREIRMMGEHRGIANIRGKNQK